MIRRLILAGCGGAAAVLASSAAHAQANEAAITPPPVCADYEDIEDEMACGTIYRAFVSDLAKARRGDVKAMRAVAKSLTDDNAIDVNLPLARFWLVRAAESGDLDAMTEIAEHHRDGTAGFAKDGARMMTWYERAHRNGHVAATINMALALRNGTGTSKDTARSLTLLREAAAKRAPMAMYHLGIAYRDGIGVTKSGKEAARWFLTANETRPGWSEPMMELGYMQLEGAPELPADVASAITIFTYVRNQNRRTEKWAGNMSLVARAEEGLGWAYEAKGPLRDPVKALAHHLAGGTSQSLVNAGVLLSNGDGMPKDHARALELYELAAIGGSAHAAWLAGNKFRNGEGTVIDLESARSWYKRAAERGHSNGAMDYAYFLSTARGGPQDIPGSVKWYRFAADKGHVTASNNYAWSIEQGRVPSADLATAVRYYKFAADKGDVSAMVSLARMYEKGTGTAINKAEALRYLRLASEKGDAKAAEELARLSAS